MDTTSRKRLRFEQARVTRIMVVQALYQIEQRNALTGDVIDEFLRYRLPSKDYPHKANPDFFKELVKATTERLADVDHMIASSLLEDWSMERMESVLKQILRVGCSELLLNPLSTPAPVIISEYVDIAKGFYEGTEPAFVNTLLDKIAHALGHPMKK
jgi:N utilization substance protein B